MGGEVREGQRPFGAGREHGAAWGRAAPAEEQQDCGCHGAAVGTVLCGKGGGEVTQGRVSVLVPRALSSQAGLGLHATLKTRIASVRYGQSVELICQVGANYTFEEVPVSVRWLFQPSPPTGHYQELVQVFPSGTVAWRAAQPRFQEKAQLTKAASSFRLRILNAEAADKGTYQCEAEVWRRNTQPLGQPAATTKSNAVGIKVELPGKQCHRRFFSGSFSFCNFKSIKCDWGNQEHWQLGYPQQGHIIES